jgi:hypothetical protein
MLNWDYVINLNKNGLQLFLIHQSVLITEFLNVIMV